MPTTPKPQEEDSTNSSPLTILKDSLSPHSLQNPPPHPTPSNNNDDDQTPQEIANTLFTNSQILAPMVRASTTPLRTLALSHGATLVYTEELVDRSIVSPTVRTYNEELGTIDYRVPKHTYSAKVQRRLENDVDNPDAASGAVLLRIDPLVERNKLIYQMGTGEPDLALEAALTVVKDVDGLDVNMGCPKKFSVSGGMGSALLSDVNRACDIIKTLRRNITGCNKPVSAKIRLLDEENPQPTVDFVRALVKAGANAIAIHGRIRGDESHIMARWGTLIRVVKELKMCGDVNVPIIVNGDLYTREDMREMKRRTGCDGIMLARPALYNVSLFNRGKEEEEELKVGGGGDSVVEDGTEEEIPISQFQQTNHSGYYGYNSPLLKSRTSIVQEYLAHCVRYKAHSKNAKYVICEMMNARRAPTTRVPYLNMEFEGGQNIQSICKCRNLNDLMKVWDCKWTTPMPSTARRGNAAAGVEAHGDLHNYDDRYFLDHDKFRKERSDALNDQLALAEKKKISSESSSSAEEKKEEGAPTSKRPKL